jgi:hypothetical protein
MVPTAEIIRFYYGPSTRLAQALFWGEYYNMFNADRSGVFAEGVVRVHLRRWLEDEDAWTSARYICSPLMQAEASEIYRNLQVCQINSASLIPQPDQVLRCGFPFAGPTTLQGVFLRLPGPMPEGPPRWLALRIERCSAPFPFDQVIVDRCLREWQWVFVVRLRREHSFFCRREPCGLGQHRTAGGARYFCVAGPRAAAWLVDRTEVAACVIPALPRVVANALPFSPAALSKPTAQLRISADPAQALWSETSIGRECRHSPEPHSIPAGCSKASCTMPSTSPQRRSCHRAQVRLSMPDASTSVGFPWPHIPRLRLLSLTLAQDETWSRSPFRIDGVEYGTVRFRSDVGSGPRWGFGA